IPGGIADPQALTLVEPVPGGIRECNNHCEFCFIRGLPAGLRPTLYVFDDDYRYSFLWGNFLTLTNLSEADWARIGYQRLSPLNVSVHATDAAVRRRMLNNRPAPPILPQLERLAGLGIRVNAQGVLCAGIKHRGPLEQTLPHLSPPYHAGRPPRPDHRRPAAPVSDGAQPVGGAGGAHALLADEEHSPAEPCRGRGGSANMRALADGAPTETGRGVCLRERRAVSARGSNGDAEGRGVRRIPSVVKRRRHAARHAPRVATAGGGPRRLRGGVDREAGGLGHRASGRAGVGADGR